MRETLRLLVFLLLPLSLGLGACGSPVRAKDVPDFTHILNIKISVEWDGERIDFDENVFCGARVKGTLTSRPVTQVLPSPTFLSRETSDGGLLRFPVSWVLCSLGQEVWRPGVTPETAFKAPSEYLPPFLWVDAVDPTERTFGIEYISETAFADPDARLKLLSPMTFSIPVHPPTEEMIAEALERADREMQLWRTSSIAPDGYMITFEEHKWRDVERMRLQAEKYNVEGADPEKLIAFLDAVPAQQRFLEIEKYSEETEPWLSPTIDALVRGDRIDGHYLYQYGLPRRGADRLGRLLEQSVWMVWPDRAVPMVCDGNRAIRPHPQLVGVRLWSVDRCVFHENAEWIEIDGTFVARTAKKFRYFFFSTRTGQIHVVHRH